MQAFQHPNGSFINDVINGSSVEDMRAKLAENQTKRELEGFHKVGERVLTRNSKCTCGSGRAIKRCCKFIK